MADIGSQSFNDTVNALITNGTSWYADVNASFVLTSGYLVFMMQLGFLLVSVFRLRALRFGSQSPISAQPVAPQEEPIHMPVSVGQSLPSYIYSPVLRTTQRTCSPSRSEI